MINIQGGYLIVSLEDDNIFEELAEIVSHETKPILIKGITEYNTKDCFISVADIIATKDEYDEVLYYTLPVSDIYINDAFCIKMAYVYPTVYTVKETNVIDEKTIINIDSDTAVEEIKKAIEDKEPEIIITGKDIEDTEVIINEIEVTEDSTTDETKLKIPYNQTLENNQIIFNYIIITKTSSKSETNITNINTYVPTSTTNELGLVKGFLGSQNENGFITTDYYTLTSMNRQYEEKIANMTLSYTTMLIDGYRVTRDYYTGINKYCESNMVISIDVPKGNPYTKFFISKDTSPGVNDRFQFANFPTIQLINNESIPLTDIKAWQQEILLMNNVGYTFKIPVLLQGRTQYPVGNDYTKQSIELRLAFDDPYVRLDVEKTSIAEGTYTIQNLIDAGYVEGSIIKIPNVHIARYKINYYNGMSSYSTYESETGLTLGDNYELIINTVSNVSGDYFMTLNKIITI